MIVRVLDPIKSHFMLILTLIAISVFSAYVYSLEERTKHSFNYASTQHQTINSIKNDLYAFEQQFDRITRSSKPVLIQQLHMIEDKIGKLQISSQMKLNIQNAYRALYQEMNKAKPNYKQIVSNVHEIDNALKLYYSNLTTSIENDILRSINIKKAITLILYVVLSLLIILSIFQDDRYHRYNKENLHLQQLVEKQNKKILNSHQKDIMDNFAGGMAHEINNALATILGRSQITCLQSTDDNVHKHLKTVEGEVFKIQKLIKNMLVSTRGFRDKVKLFNVTELASNVISNSPLKDRIEYQDPTNHFYVNGSAREAQMIFIEIIENGIHFSNKGESINVSMEPVDKKQARDWGLDIENQFLQIRFEDKGCGIEDTKKIFNPFYTTREIGEGSGLGMVTVLNFVHAMDGEIVVESIVGEGTIVIVLLPLDSEGTVQDERAA